MTESDGSGWSVIRGAAEGNPKSRREFTHLYEPVIRTYLLARWRRTPLYEQIDDAAQDCFADCFRDGGAFIGVDSDQSGGFRAFLYGVVRNIARRQEEKRGADNEGLPVADESLSRIFDRAWALAVVNQAADLYAERAREQGGVSMRRLELLRLRFGENMRLWEIADAWKEDPAKLEAEYAQGRSEFKAALREMLRTLHPDGEVEAECDHLLALLE